MKKILILFITMFLCFGLFAEIKYYKKENLENIEFSIPGEYLYETEITMIAECDTEAELLKILHKNKLNLNDHFCCYMTLDDNVKNNSYIVLNCFDIYRSNNFFYVVYKHNNVEELFYITN